MNNGAFVMTMGKKIGTGFGLLLCILAITGGYACLRMKEAAQGAKLLSADYVPEYSFSSDLQQAVGAAMLSTRTYGYTGDAKDLQAARKALVDVKTMIVSLQTLADSSTKLVRLKEDIQKLTTSYQAYESAINETEKANGTMATLREETAKYAAESNKHLAALLQAQHVSLAADLKAGISSDNLAERQQKIQLYEDLGNLFVEYRSIIKHPPISGPSAVRPTGIGAKT